MDIVWGIYRDDKGYINLLAVFQDLLKEQEVRNPEGQIISENLKMACDFLQMLMEIKPIGSRQIAALAMAHALQMVGITIFGEEAGSAFFVCGRCGGTDLRSDAVQGQKGDSADPSIVCKKCYDEIVGKQ